MYYELMSIFAGIPYRLIKSGCHRGWYQFHACVQDADYATISAALDAFTERHYSGYNQVHHHPISNDWFIYDDNLSYGITIYSGWAWQR